MMTMSDFKVGDRVKLTFNNDFGTIVDEEEDCFGKHRQYKVLLDGDSDAIYYSKLSLELVDVNNKTQDQQKIEQLEKRIEKLEKCSGIGKYATDRKENVPNFEKMTQKSNLLSEDEIVILKNLDKKWKWIARDCSETLFVYDEKPERHIAREIWRNGFDSEDICVFNHLFQFIKWVDKEPYNIEELLKGECGNEN